MTGDAQDSCWLSTPLVTSGTVQAGCCGCFRKAGVVDIVVDRCNELQLLSVTPAATLAPEFQQPLFCRVKQMCVLPFSQHQPQDKQGQVLDHLLVLLESGMLMVLKYSHVVNLFYIAAEMQLAAAAVGQAADFLGACMAVSAHVTPAGEVSVAVAAKRGRVACLTTYLDSTGGVQFSSPVVYAAEAPKVLGASYRLAKQDSLELGNIMDLVLLSGTRHGQSIKGHKPVVFLAVLSHRPEEVASELVMFSWSCGQQQLCRLGAVALHHNVGAVGMMGAPLRMAAVPSCPTAVVITREWGLWLLDCRTLMSPQHQVLACSVEYMQHMTCRFQQRQLPYQQWAHHHHTLHCTTAKCVARLKPQPKQEATPPAPHAKYGPSDDWGATLMPDDDLLTALGYADTQPPGAVEAGQLGAAQAGDGEAAAGREGRGAATVLRGPPLPAVGAAPPAGGLADDPAGNTIQQGAAHMAERLAQHVTGTAQAEAAADDDMQVVDDDTGPAAGAEEPPASGSESGLDQQQPPQQGPGGGSVYKSPASSSEEDDDGAGAVIEPTAITAIAWTSSTLPAKVPASYAGLPDSTHIGTAAPATATGPSLADEVLLVSTSCGCVLEMTVSITDGSLETRLAAVVPDWPGTTNGSSCISISSAELVFEADAQGSINSHGTRLGPVLLPLPQQQVLLVADDHSCLRLLQKQAGPNAAAGVGHAATGMESGFAACGSAAAAAAAAGDEAQPEPSSTVAINTAAAVPADSMDVDPHHAAVADADSVQRPRYVRLSTNSNHSVPTALHTAAPAAGSPTSATSGSNQSSQPPATAAAASGSPLKYSVADELQLLGRVGPILAVQPPDQGQVAAAAGAQNGHEAAGIGRTLFTSGQQQRQQQQQPLLIAARAGHESGIRVLHAAAAASELLRGPAGMLEGASAMWPIAAAPDSHEHAALLFSFSAGASRALSVGVQFRDVTEVLGLQAAEGTLLAACVAEGLMAQVTRAGVHLCCMDGLLNCNSDGDTWAWHGSPKSSRSRGGQHQQQGMAATKAAAGEGPVAGSPAGAGVSTSMPCGIGKDSGSSSTSGSMSPHPPPAAHAGRPQPSRLAISSCAELPSDAAAGATEAGAAGGHYTSDAAAVAASSTMQQGYSGEAQAALHWSLQVTSHQQSSSAGIVLAAAAAGIVTLYTSEGSLVVLGVCSKQHQQRRGLVSDSHDPSSGMQQAAAAATVAAAGPGGKSAVVSGCSSKKRARLTWGLVEACSMQLGGRVSCLQVCPIMAAAAAAGSCVESSSSHVLLVGRYDGSLTLLAAHMATGSIHQLAVFEQQLLLPLQYLAGALRGSNAAPSACALGRAPVQSVAVPDSCVMHAATQPASMGVTWAAPAVGQQTSTGAGAAAAAVGGDAATGSAPTGGAGTHAAAKRAKQQVGNAAVGAGEGSGCLQLFVSYRTGDVAAYTLDLPVLLQLHDQQQSQLASAAAAAAPPAAVHLRVLAQVHLPCMVQLQPLAQPHHVLAAGGSAWVLELDSITKRLSAHMVAREGVILASGLFLPVHSLQRLLPDQQQQSQQQPGAQCKQHTRRLRGSGANQASQQQQQQQPGMLGLQLQQQVQLQPQHSSQHLAIVSPRGELQLLGLVPLQQSRQLAAGTWMPHTTVTHLLMHTGSNLLLAACAGYTSVFTPQGLAGRDLGAEESSWLQVLNPVTGAQLAAFLPCKTGAQWITCMCLWDAAWKAPGSVVPSQPLAQEGHVSSAAAAEQATDAAGAQGNGAEGAAAGVGARARWGRGGGSRWWHRLRPLRRTEDPQAPAVGQAAEPQQGGSSRVHRRHGGGGGAAAAAADGSSSGSDHFFQLGSLLKGLDSPLSGCGAAGRAASSSRSSQGSKAVKQRRGPLIVLGTEAFGELDGCNGQVLVLQLMQTSRNNMQQQHTESHGQAAHACSSKAAASQPLSGAAAAAAQCDDSSPCASPASDHAASSGHGSSWSLQRIARLRMPESVTAVAAFGSDLLLVALQRVLVLYQIQQQDQLVKAAYCFTRAPIVSLAPAPYAVMSEAGPRGNSVLGLVLAADTLLGCVAYQVNLHAATGQYSLQPVGMHCDVRHTSQVMWLPPALLPPTSPAVIRAVELAEKGVGPLCSRAPPQQQQARGSTSTRASQRQQPHPQPQPHLPHGVVAAQRAADPSAAAAAAQVLGADAGKQMQQLLEALMRGMCLDDAGAVAELCWAQQRTAPVRWLQTAACAPLGAKAATGSLQVLLGSTGKVQPQPQLQGVGQQSMEHILGLLPRGPAIEDGVPLHWITAGLLGLGCGRAVVVAGSNGRVLHLQRLPGPEGRLLMALQNVLLHHPLTSSMMVGREQVLLRSNKQHPGQHQPLLPESRHHRAAGGSSAQPAAAPAGSSQTYPVGLPPQQLGVVDGEVLRLFLALPFKLQLLLLDSSAYQLLQQACGGLAGVVCDSSEQEEQAGQEWAAATAASSSRAAAAVLQDGLRCRLQQLVPSFQL